MKPVAKNARRGAWKTTCGTGTLFFFLVIGCLRLHGKDAPLEELLTAEQVRQMPRELAARQNPVHLRGVVTFFDQKNYFRFHPG